ncbi:MAG: DUF6790 family protein [Nakamurella sp.]
MIANTIAALIGNYMTTCFVVGLIVAAIQTYRRRGRLDSSLVSALFLNSFILWAIGVAQAVNFVMHSVFGDFAAETIGWAQSPFQLELAFSSLGIAVMAFILHGRTTQLRAKVALIAATAVFAYGAAGGHIYQMVANSDYAKNNSGLLLVMDVVIASAGIALASWHAAARRRTIARAQNPATSVLAGSR